MQLEVTLGFFCSICTEGRFISFLLLYVNLPAHISVSFPYLYIFFTLWHSFCKLTFDFENMIPQVNEKGLSVETADEIGTFVKERGSPLELLKKLKKEGSKFLGNNESRLALEELEILFKALEKSKCIDKVVFDLSLARGLDYYTGVIFEAVFKGATQVDSKCQ